MHGENGIHQKQFANDTEAFEHANGYSDEGTVPVERLINGIWCQCSSPLYNPQFYYGSKDGGWMSNGKLVQEFD
jgi:hypothetical protein